MSNMLNISRGPAGWTVRMVRDGVEYSKYFRFTDGGVRGSLAKAKKYRDSLTQQLGARQWRTGPRKKASNNTSGVTGVSRNFYGRWLATWQEDGQQRFKTFKTKREAVAHRKLMVGE